DCAEHPAGLWLSDDFVVFRAREIWRRGPRALGWRRVGAGRLCQTETAGGLSSHHGRISYPRD
ncbi:hypothetical protein, partial [Aeromonas veronii]|uniref:hypothetical protein n=1 Tax=Aeromonas veronii TaxID=654 RepID=UPI001F38A8FC